MDEFLTVTAAAGRIGVTTQAVYRAFSDGRLRNYGGQSRPAILGTREVDRFIAARRTEAAPRHPDLLAFATEVRQSAWPEVRTAPQGHADAFSALIALASPKGRDARIPLDAVALFGAPSIDALTAVRPGSGVCRWCLAMITDSVRGGGGPVESSVYATLFGAGPCARDRKEFAAFSAALNRTSRPIAPAPVAARRPAPVQDDAALRRATVTRLTNRRAEALRTGDRTYAAQLARMIAEVRR